MKAATWVFLGYAIASLVAGSSAVLIKQWIASRTAASLILTRHRIRPTRTVACMAGVNSTVAIPSLPQPQLSTVASEFVSLRRWIHVLNFDEGIASWRESLAELLYLAHTYKATLVEPCMKNGRLMSCARLPSSGRVHLSQVLDFRHLQKTYGSSIIASHRLFDGENVGRSKNIGKLSGGRSQKSFRDVASQQDDVFARIAPRKCRHCPSRLRTVSSLGFDSCCKINRVQYLHARVRSEMLSM